MMVIRRSITTPAQINIRHLASFLVLIWKREAERRILLLSWTIQFSGSEAVTVRPILHGEQTAIRRCVSRTSALKPQWPPTRQKALTLSDTPTAIRGIRFGYYASLRLMEALVQLGSMMRQPSSGMNAVTGRSKGQLATAPIFLPAMLSPLGSI